MNKKTAILKIWIIAFLATTIMLSCQEEHISYSGPTFVQFADTMVVLPIMDNETYHEVFISSSQTADHDRNFGIEVLTAETNAIEGYHFDLESSTVTIKAGERVASIKIKGYEAKVAEDDSLGLTLSITNVHDEYTLSGIKSHVILKKVCPFDINNYTGYCLMESQFLNSYSSETLRLIESVIDPEDSNVIILKDFLQDGFDLKVNIDHYDLLNPTLTIDDEQDLAYGSDFFSYIYGNDVLRAAQPANYTSFFNNCSKYFLLYTTIYVDEVGVVGTYASAVSWISDAEADYLKDQGY